MPTYDYRCVPCNSTFQIVHSMSAAAPACPRCAGQMKRLILSAPAFHGGMARGRERAVGSLPECGKGCRCCPDTSSKVDVPPAARVIGTK